MIAYSFYFTRNVQTHHIHWWVGVNSELKAHIDETKMAVSDPTRNSWRKQVKEKQKHRFFFTGKLALLNSGSPLISGHKPIENGSSMWVTKCWLVLLKRRICYLSLIIAETGHLGFNRKSKQTPFIGIGIALLSYFLGLSKTYIEILVMVVGNFSAR